MKKLISVIGALFFTGIVCAQSADVLTDILNSETATLGQVSYLCAVQQQLVSEAEGYDAAVNAEIAAGYLSDSESASDELTLSKAAYLLSKNWSIKGGLFYSLSKGSPRYVFKQLVSDGVISATEDPSSKISGSDLLVLYSSCLKKYGDFDISAVSMEVE